jgi:uncharacterized membrane protein
MIKGYAKHSCFLSASRTTRLSSLFIVLFALFTISTQVVWVEIETDGRHERFDCGIK